MDLSWPPNSAPCMLRRVGAFGDVRGICGTLHNVNEDRVEKDKSFHDFDHYHASSWFKSGSLPHESQGRMPARVCAHDERHRSPPVSQPTNP